MKCNIKVKLCLLKNIDRMSIEICKVNKLQCSLLVYIFWAAGFIQYKSIFSIQYFMSQNAKTKLKKPVEFTHKLTIYNSSENIYKQRASRQT
jgi:hypothetical protein